MGIVYNMCGIMICMLFNAHKMVNRYEQCVQHVWDYDLYGVYSLKDGNPGNTFTSNYLSIDSSNNLVFELGYNIDTVPVYVYLNVNYGAPTNNVVKMKISQFAYSNCQGYIVADPVADGMP